jgi:tRNA pseudouridine38-40 synthase
MKFVGWQEQQNHTTVQGTLQAVFYQLTGEQIKIYGSGRTDRGVHALGQVCHFDSNTIVTNKLIYSLNYFLQDIVILNLEEVDTSFDARFSAQARIYEYKILNRKNPSIILYERAWHVHQQLNLLKMQQMANYLVGLHDFNSFRSRYCQAQSSIRSLDYIKISQVDEIISIELQAKSFLHNQVRVIVGTLKYFHHNNPDSILKILKARDRTAAGPTAPPYGLYLKKILY